ncbi:hypothetical protein AB205_0063190 [Aquarana catesbeiana]|uniref:EF-hand domain-containing protein n=1 Tax=Aquarana catesbeiana TaxID=8400 RepID=A0A2G9RQ17_AQUCT|nr:hypothetical protein AB205_0063190 [Aquarana catesbeiana]
MNDPKTKKKTKKNEWNENEHILCQCTCLQQTTSFYCCLCLCWVDSAILFVLVTTVISTKSYTNLKLYSWHRIGVKVEIFNESNCSCDSCLKRKRKSAQRDTEKKVTGICSPIQNSQDQTDVHFGKDFFQRNPSAARSDTYINMREVSKRLKLPVGDYLIVPSTFEPFKTGDFCLRVFSEKAAKSLEVGDVAKGNPYEPQVSDKDVPADFKNIFDKLAGGKGEINAKDIQAILNKLLARRTDLKSSGFTMATCREMISLMDDIFIKADSDRSGTMDAHEMRMALHNAEMFNLLDTNKSGTIDLTLPEYLYDEEMLINLSWALSYVSFFNINNVGNKSILNSFIHLQAQICVCP